MKYEKMEIKDLFTGELREVPASRNHYEENDGVPVAPRVDVKRPTVRQRIENLLSRGVDPLAHYVGTEGIDMEVPDDPEAPLTPSEANYLDTVAEALAEQAPLPDEGLPRAVPEPPPLTSAASSGAPAAPAAEGAGGAPGPVPPKQAVPTR